MDIPSLISSSVIREDVVFKLVKRAPGAQSTINERQLSCERIGCCEKVPWNPQEAAICCIPEPRALWKERRCGVNAALLSRNAQVIELLQLCCRTLGLVH